MTLLATLRNTAAIALLLCATGLSAQTVPEIRLAAKDGGLTVRGQFVGIQDGMYIVETRAGLTKVPVDKVECIFGCDVLAASGAAGTVEATETVAVSEPEPAPELAPETVVETVAVSKPAAAPAEAELIEVAAAAPESAPVMDEVPAERKFGIHGSRTLGTFLMPNLIEAYAAKIGATVERQEVEKGISVMRLVAADGSVLAEIDLQIKGSGTAFPGLGEGLAQIGMADRRMNDGDLAKLGGLGDLRDTPNEIILGLDGIVALVHPSNPLDTMTFEDLSRVFSGEVTNWKELGGPDLAVRIHTFPDGSGDRSIFAGRAVDPYGRAISASAVEHTEYAEMREAIAADPGAVGYLGRSFVRDDVKPVSIREQCGLVSAPTSFRMKTEGYAMSRRIYLYRTPGPLNPIAQDLIDFALSPEGQQVLVATNFVDRDYESQGLDQMGVELGYATTQEDFRADAFGDLLRELGQAERLSVAFRFMFGEAQLDPLAEASVESFVQQLESGAFAGKEVLVVGFADAVGSFRQNQKLALARATVISDLLRDRLGTRAAESYGLKAVSYGELLPYLCNEDEFGRAANRRVEIWLR